MQPTRVLKAHDARNLGSRAVFNYEDIRKRCDEGIEHARQQAREILDNAAREAEEIRRNAHSSGLAAGRETAVRDVEAEIQRRSTELAEKLSSQKLQTTLPAMLAAVSALDRERDRWLADWEAFGVRLSVAIARKIIRHELELHPENVTAMLGETLRLAAGSTNISLRLHPDDVRLLGDHPTELARNMAACAEAAIVPDENVERGGCVIESQHGVIDARIETQLQRIVDELLQAGVDAAGWKEQFACMIAIEEQLEHILPVALTGSVTRLVGLTAAVAGFPAPLGAVCRIDREQAAPVEAAVIGFQGDETLLLSYGDLVGVRRGNRVTLVQSVPGVRVGERLLGRVLDGRGRVLDGRPALTLPHRVELYRSPPSALARPRIDSPLGTGVRTIDSLLTCGRGQRLGIFSGSGVGKSTLLGQMARASSADVNVIILVGERGREVREFLERDLGPGGLEKSVVIVATSDEPALIRLQAAFLGTAVAEYFRDCGRDVLLMMDSVTRFALAQREIGLAAGEPPATRGYPPSVFGILPRLLERSGRSERGSITGLYTVLVEGDDTNEPISDTVRGILDGHIVLSRKLAEQTHWPAIDVLASISRSMTDVVDKEHLAASNSVKQLMAAYQQSEDLISIGAYQNGTMPIVDQAIQMREPIKQHLQQESTTSVDFAQARDGLLKLAKLRETLHTPAARLKETKKTGAVVGKATAKSTATPDASNARMLR